MRLTRLEWAALDLAKAGQLRLTDDMRPAISELVRMGLVKKVGDSFELTFQGRKVA